MPKVDILNMEGSVVDSLELNDAVFGIEPNHSALHQVVKAVASERHWPCPPRIHPQPAVASWRRCICAQTAQLPPGCEQKGPQAGNV